MILILGTPGAGKTTQTKLLAEHLGCPWLSMGELFRNNSSGRARRDMLAGKIVNDEDTIKLLDDALKEIDTSKEVVFEGNPRSIKQAQWWIDQAKAGRFKIRGVVHLIADKKVAAERLVQRGRLDDHDDNVVETRFAEYERSITPTLNFLKQNGVTVHDVDANGTIEQEAGLIRKALGIKNAA
jgi:adenylate kinase